MISFVKEVGLGLAALQTFSKCLNSPPPMNQNSYDTLFCKYSEATKTVAEESMNKLLQRSLKSKRESMIPWHQLMELGSVRGTAVIMAL